MTEALRLGVTLLAPVIPGTTAKVNAALGHTPALNGAMNFSGARA